MIPIVVAVKVIETDRIRHFKRYVTLILLFIVLLLFVITYFWNLNKVINKG